MLTSILGKAPWTLAELNLAILGLGILFGIVVIVPVCGLAWFGAVSLKALWEYVTRR